MISAIALLIATPAAVQTAPAPAPTAAAVAPAVGAKVFDPTDGDVGTIVQMTPDAAVVDTGAHKAAVPLTAFSTGPKGLRITLTKAQLDEAAAGQQAQMQAQLKSQLVAGTSVRGAGGTTVVGTIKAADDQFVTLTTAKGEVKLPVAGFGMDQQGVIVGMTAAQLDAAVAGATPPATN